MEAGPRHSWLRFPWALLAGVLALAPLVSLLPIVSYRMVSPWWLSLTLWVAVGEVALLVVPSVMLVVRSLQALLWLTASLMLLMLLVVGVGLCLGCQWPVFGVGRWLVPVPLSGRVCSRWRGLLVMLLVRVVPPVVWVLLVTAWWMAPCGWFGGRGLLLMCLGVCLRLLWSGVGGLLVHRLWWLWFPLVAEVAGGDADGGVMLAMVC